MKVAMDNECKYLQIEDVTIDTLKAYVENQRVEK